MRCGAAATVAATFVRDWAAVHHCRGGGWLGCAVALEAGATRAAGGPASAQLFLHGPWLADPTTRFVDFVEWSPGQSESDEEGYSHAPVVYLVSCLEYAGI